MPSHSSRRDFISKLGLASAAVVVSNHSAWATGSSNFFGSGPNSKFAGVQIGAITYSFRSMPGKPEQLLQYCIDAGISAIELMGDSVEDYAGKPVSTFQYPPRVNGQAPVLTAEQKAQIAAYQQQVAEWRAGVSMDKFKE